MAPRRRAGLGPGAEEVEKQTLGTRTGEAQFAPPARVRQEGKVQCGVRAGQKVRNQKDQTVGKRHPSRDIHGQAGSLRTRETETVGGGAPDPCCPPSGRARGPGTGGARGGVQNPRTLEEAKGSKEHSNDAHGPVRKSVRSRPASLLLLRQSHVHDEMVTPAHLSTLPLGIGGILAKMMPDNYYDKMTLGDQILTQSYMGYTDPETGMANKDPFGINVRSGFGNYSEYADKTVDKLNEALAKSAARFAAKNEGVTVDPITGELKGDQSLIDQWNDLTKNMQTRRGYYTNVTNKKKDIAADLALIQKAKDQERAAADLAAQKALATANKGFLNSQEAARMTSQQQGERAAGMGGGSRQAKSGSQKAGGSGRKDGGWGWKDGGRVYLYNRLK